MRKKLSWVVIVGIRLYQRFLSLDHGMIGRIIPVRGRTCVFYPSCSEYMILAIQKHGLVQGIAMGVKRILSCRPSRGPSVDFP